MRREPRPGEPAATDRLREPPARRLADPELVVDIAAVTATLRGEPGGPTQHGHRQMAVLHRGHMRVVLFTFDAGGELPDHTANGIVSIHVLSGELTVRTQRAEHRLRAGMVLVLDPLIAHSVMAAQPAEMLLTVHLDQSLGTSREAQGEGRPEA